MRQRILGLLLIGALVMPLVLGATLTVQARAGIQDVRRVSDERAVQIKADLETIQASLTEVDTAFTGVPDAIDATTAAIDEVKNFVENLTSNVPAWLAFLTGFQGAINDTVAALDDLAGVVRSIASIHALPGQFEDVMDESRMLVDDLAGVYDTRAGTMLWLGGLLAIWLAGVYLALVWKWLHQGWQLLVGASPAT
jgi:hypothetical protein